VRRKTVALTMAPPSVCSFLFNVVFIVSIFAHTALSLIQYDRQALLDACASIRTNFFSDYRSTSCKPFVLPPVCCLPTHSQRKKKRGKCAGILWRYRTRCHNLPLPSIFLAYVQSLDNKMDELHAQINFQWGTANYCMMAFTETWLGPTIPDSAIASAGFSIYWQDRTREWVKHRGGAVCFMLNSGWGSDVAVPCSPDLELLSIKVRPFYRPWELSSVIITAVHIPPQADTTQLLKD